MYVQGSRLLRIPSPPSFPRVGKSIRYALRQVLRKKLAHAHSVCTRPFLLPSKGLGTRLNSSMNSQRVIAGRDLENSLLKGRRSRLYKQYTSLQSYYDHSLYNQPYCSAVTVEATVPNLYCVLGLVLACATQCH